jgi:hypothetical protein
MLDLIRRDEWIRLHQVETDDDFEISGKLNIKNDEDAMARKQRKKATFSLCN